MNEKKKVVLISGCSSGLGFATAAELVKSGYIVYAGMRNLSAKEALEKACDNSPNLFVKGLDLSDSKSIAKFHADLIQEQKRIDIIINNASTALIGPVDSATPEEVRYLFEVNVIGTIALTQKFIPLMRKQKSGHIIMITSISGVESSAFLGVYAATKYAQEAIATSWATTLHKWNIQVTIVQPGAMNTNLPHSIPIGTYYSNQEDPYHTFNQNARKFLKECLEGGADPKSVALQLKEIIENPNPKFRYQTCDYSENLVHRHLNNPQLTEWIAEHRDFVDGWYQTSCVTN